MSQPKPAATSAADRESRGGETSARRAAGPAGEWVLLSYRLPREPSGPRTAVWRKLKRLGVAQVSDGLVALPAGPRTREQLEWVSEEVIDAGGTATIWLASPASHAQERQLAQMMAAARAAEYQQLAAAAAAVAASPAGAASALRRLRNDLRAIQRRDYFPPAERDHAEAAVQALTSHMPAERTEAQPDRGLPQPAGTQKTAPP